MSWHVRWTKPAQKGLRKIPKKQRAMLLSWVEKNLDDCNDPRAIQGGKPIQGSDNGWRWRVGSYRILGQILDDEIVINIVRVGHRQGVYGNLPKL